jgi:probable HAF family extracellular repeat protein
MAVNRLVTSRIFQKVALTAIGWSLSVSVLAAYVVTELPGLGVTGSAPYGVDNSGAVSGTSTTTDNKTRAFLWKNGTMTDLGTYFSTTSWGYKSNPAGQVTVYSLSGASPGTYLYSNGLMKFITSGVGYGINAAGNVVGGFGGAFLYKDGVLTDLGTFSRGTATARAINNAGTIVGYASDTNGASVRGFIWKNGGVTQIQPMAGDSSIAIDINDAGDVMGLTSIAADPNTWHVFIWKNGVMTDTGISALNRDIPSNGYSINNSGHVLTPGGVFINNVFTPVAAMLPPEWAQGYRADTNTFWYFPALTGMNDAGQLTGSVLVQNLTTNAGKRISFLLTPGTLCNK